MDKKIQLDKNSHYQNCIDSLKVRILKIQLDIEELRISESTRLLLMGEITGLTKAMELLEQFNEEG